MNVSNTTFYVFSQKKYYNTKNLIEYNIIIRKIHPLYYDQYITMKCTEKIKEILQVTSLLDMAIMSVYQSDCRKSHLLMHNFLANVP